MRKYAQKQARLPVQPIIHDFLKLKQLAEISGTNAQTSTLNVMSTTGAPHLIDGHDKHFATITLFLAPSNCASSVPEATPKKQALAATARALVKAGSKATQQAQQFSSAPVLARTLSSASSSSASSHSTSTVLLGKDIAASVGMRVEMKEAALAKARGAGVVNSVCKFF